MADCVSRGRGGSANNHDNRDYSRRDVPHQLNSNGLLIKNCTEWWVTVSEILFRGRYWPRAITSYYSRWNDHHQGVILGTNVIFFSPRHSCSLRTDLSWILIETQVYTEIIMTTNWHWVQEAKVENLHSIREANDVLIEGSSCSFCLNSYH